MLQGILAALVLLAPQYENIFVVNALEAMRTDNGGCIGIRSFQPVGGFTPGIIFEANMDPAVNAWLGETKDSEAI